MKIAATTVITIEGVGDGAAAPTVRARSAPLLAEHGGPHRAEDAAHREQDPRRRAGKGEPVPRPG